MKVALFAILLTFILLSCDEGIAPLEPTGEGFAGIITFTGEWPDSVRRTHLVVFENPLNSAADFSAFNLKYISNEIPFGTTEFNFNTAADSALIPIRSGTYRYIAVAQSASPTVSLDRKDWFVVGVYHLGDPAIPAVLTIPEKRLITGVNIICNFNNLPPQPPGGN